MKLQLSLEIIMSMIFTMLIAFVVLQAYSHEYSYVKLSLSEVSGYANASSGYVGTLSGLCRCI